MIERFRELHKLGTFLLPNPWDRGSAMVLEGIGVLAIATTSAGFARSIGKEDQEVTRDELVRHVAELAECVSIPINVDSERLYPDDPGGIARCVELLVDAGAAGVSIEDYNPDTDDIDPLEMATERVAEAATAARLSGVVLTARTENYLYGIEDIDLALERLVAYREAGADCLYAPGLTSSADIAAVVDATDAPVNVLKMPKVKGKGGGAMPGGPSIAELKELGARRISTGSALYNNAYQALRSQAATLHAPLAGPYEDEAIRS